MKRTVLIADDEESIVTVLTEYFRDKGFCTITANNGMSAERLLRKKAPELALMDINMPDKNGLAVLKSIKKTAPNATSIIIMTAESSMSNAIDAMKHGAFDYLTKPLDLDDLDITIGRVLENLELKAEVSTLKERLKERVDTETTFIGKSKAVQTVFKTIGRVAPKDVTVLLQGESGTGKELVARILHANSPRAEMPFIAINAAAIPGDLMESELFGAEKGAFTGATTLKKGKFELANGGTLFLDEIGEMDKKLQVKLLRVLQNMEFYRLGGKELISADLRLITATNQNLEKAVAEGRFREDLYYRLNVVRIKLPPLRKRKEDIPLLTNHFLSKFCTEMNIEMRKLSKKALADLEIYNWPGNVRELENILRRTVLLSPNLILSPDDIKLPKLRPAQESIEDIIERRLEPFIEKTANSGRQELYDSIMPFMERPLIRLVLRKTNFNQVKASELLGINRNTLRKKIKELKIKRTELE
jgi:two-component system nitrogen regulation response regulator GlnG